MDGVHREAKRGLQDLTRTPEKKGGWPLLEQSVREHEVRRAAAAATHRAISTPPKTSSEDSTDNEDDISSPEFKPRSRVPQPRPVSVPRQHLPTDDGPECPGCDLTMKLRYQKATGQPFWGCSAYPACSGTLPLVAQRKPVPTCKQCGERGHGRAEGPRFPEPTLLHPRVPGPPA